MAPGPASLENKQERPSSDRQATLLFSCYHCWPNPTDLTGADTMNFILKISTVPAELALLETFLIITLKFSRGMAAEPDFLRCFEVTQSFLSSSKWLSYMEHSINCTPARACSKSAPEVRGGTLRTDCWCSGESCSFNFLPSYLRETSTAKQGH